MLEKCKESESRTIFQNIDLDCPLWLLMVVWNCDMLHNKKIVTWHINYILKKTK